VKLQIMNNGPEKHHRRSIRLQGYDYSRSGTYFVTLIVICPLFLDNPPPSAYA